MAKAVEEEKKGAPLYEVIYGVLREHIVDGSFPAGLILGESIVARAFNASRVPAGVALRRLHGEGLIKDFDGRGFQTNNGGAAPVRLELAEAFNMAVCPHFLMELHVGLAAAVPNGRWIEYIPQLDSLTTAGMRIDNGRAVPSAEPGLGIAWDWAAVERQRVDGATRVIR